MGALAANFITDFNQLCGESIKERQANSYQLFHLYKRHLEKNTEDLDLIVQDLKCLTIHFQKILYIDFLIYFRRVRELSQELSKGNDIVVSKLAKQKWFFVKAFDHLSDDEFVENFLPMVGYNVKLKILRRLIVSEDKCDKIFDALRKRYGLLLALNVLTKCSNAKILEVVNAETIRLTVRQFKQIHEKNPSLIRVYIEKRSKYERSLAWLNDSPLFHYLALKNPKLFADLVQKDEFVTKLGRRTSKTVIKAQTQRILEKPELWIEILNTNKLVKHLGEHYKELFFGGEKPVRYWKSLLTHYPKKDQFKIYKTIYDSIHRHKFGECPDTILTEILEIIPEAATREKYAIIKYNKNLNVDYLVYYTPRYCLDEFITKLPHLKKWEREKYLKIATKCSILNRDSESLLKLCEIVAKRLKNDYCNIRREFFSHFCSQKKIFDYLTEPHWKLLMEIDAITIAQNENNFFATEIRIQYVEFLIQHNEPINQAIAAYPANWQEHLFWKLPTYKRKGKLLQDIILSVVDSGYPKSSQTKKNLAAMYDCEVAALVQNFNKALPKYALDVYNNKRIRKSVLQMMQAKNLDDNTSFSFQGILYMVCQKNITNSQTINQMHNLFFVNLKKYGNLKHCLWFAKHEPNVLKNHFQAVLDNYLNMVGDKATIRTFWKTIKKYDHCKLVEEAREMCKKKIQEKGSELKKHMSLALMIILPAKSSLEFITKECMPVSSKTNSTDQSVKDLYTVQSECIKHLHLVQHPAKILDLVLKFCEGDLKHVLHPLYSCCYRLQEKDSLEIIEQLSRVKALSTRKHAIHLSCAVLPQTTTLAYLEQRSIISLLPTMKYLKNNPSPTLWELLEKKILGIEKKNLDDLKYLFDISLPAAYNSKLFECAWTTLNKNGNTSLKRKLFRKTTKHVSFNMVFIKQLVLDCLLKAEYTNLLLANVVLDFDENKHFRLIKKALINSKLNKTKLKSFVQTLFQAFIQRKSSNVAFANNFSKVYNDVFEPHEALEEYVLVNLMALKEETIEEAATIVMIMFQNFKQSYGTSASLLLADIVQNKVFPHVYKKSDQVFVLCYNLTKKFCIERDDYLWIIKLLPKTVPESTETFNVYSKIRNELIAFNDFSIKLNFNLNLMSGLSNNNFEQDMLL